MRELARVPSLSNMIALSQQGVVSIKARERKEDARAELQMSAPELAVVPSLFSMSVVSQKMVLSSESKNRRMRSALVETWYQSQQIGSSMRISSSHVRTSMSGELEVLVWTQDSASSAHLNHVHGSPTRRVERAAYPRMEACRISHNYNS